MLPAWPLPQQVAKAWHCFCASDPIQYLILQAKSGVLDLETGRAATVSTGRPNLEQLLGDLVLEGESASSVGVIVSGIAQTWLS